MQKLGWLVLLCGTVGLVGCGGSISEMSAGDITPVDDVNTAEVVAPIDGMTTDPSAIDGGDAEVVTP